MFQLSSISPSDTDGGGALPATAAPVLAAPDRAVEETVEAKAELEVVEARVYRVGLLAGDRPQDPARSAPVETAPPTTATRSPASTLLSLALVLATLGVATAVGRAQTTPVLVPGSAAQAQAVLQETGALPLSLPYGKGMWIWQVEQTESGDVDAIVARARANNLSHLYVRVGSSWDGFYGGPFLDRLLPKAHAGGIRVYGWDFPNLASWTDDVARASTAMGWRTPDHHKLDGFAADIETEHEGTHISAEAAAAYGNGLRQAVGAGYPLIAAVPRPSPQRASFPFAQVVASFDAIAPMVYWLNRQPDTDVGGAMRDLAKFGKPIFPIGQAYDGAPEGGRPGVPPRAELLLFMVVADQHQAGGVSFWSWQAADQQAWDAIRDAPQFSHGPSPI